MQVQKKDIRKTILKAAREDFLQHGFKDSSMRRIAKISGVGLSNIYNYFKSKDEIFREVLAPLLHTFDVWLKKHNSENYISVDVFTMKSFQQEMLNIMLSILKGNREDLRLLLFEASGSSLENFKDTITDRQTEAGLEYLQLMKEKYPHLNTNVSPFFIHIMSSWLVTMMGEIVMHSELSDEEMEIFLAEYVLYATAGWKELMNA